MIVKMKFLSITGPKDDIERMAGQYLSRYEFQLENALTELKTVRDLRAYTDKSQRAELSEEREKTVKSLENIEPFLGLKFEVHRLLGFRYVKYRFGRISNEYFDKFERYVYDTLDTIFYKCSSDEEYVWGVYFVPASMADQIDAVYASMHFEHIFLPDEYDGTPSQARQALEERIADLDRQLEELDQRIASVTAEHTDELAGAMQFLEKRSASFDIRKFAALTKEKDNVFYILCGWMPEKQADAFQKEIEDDEKTFVVVEDDHDNIFSTPPTKLKNPKVFRPFEMYVKMYGLPAYNELDPTMFVALTYAFIFGAMFGDVGQGLVLLLGGLFLYKKKGMDLAAIIASAGVFSTFFGFMYGSFFGFEDTLIKHIWLKPKEAMMTLPVIGQMNTVFVVAIVFGMFLILTAMILHIIVCVRNHDAEGTWFDTNGVAGFLFYGFLVASLILVMSGHTLPGAAILVIILGLPLLAMAFKEPLGAWLEKKKAKFDDGIPMYLVQTFFEMFEVLLSFFSNTLSFVRIGAFAVSHAAMMEVVLMLAGFTEGGSGNWLIIVLGNAFVCAMEGLIVGIQVLRLEYYELFSRFYKGTGHAFRPYEMKK